MSKIVISLTSYPARIYMVNQVIESLFRQKEQADEIVLWLSILEFPNRNYDLPENLRCLIGKKGFRIEWVNENIKSHKKYFYALQNKENITITVDDDAFYSEMMVSTLMDSYRKHPYAISARNVHIITRRGKEISPYLMWESEVSEYIDVERMDLCAIGVNGILYPPGCGKARWFDIQMINQSAENQDDLWLKFNEIIDRIPVVYTGLKEEDKTLESSRINPLCVENAGGGNNDLSIKKLFNELKRNYQTSYYQWFDSLMSVDEFWHARRGIYNFQLNDIIVQSEDRKIYICGAGKYAHILFEFIKSCGKEKYIAAFLVTGNLKSELGDDDISVKRLRDIEKTKRIVVICGVGEYYKKEFRKALEPYKSHEWVDMDLLGIERLLQWEKENILMRELER